MPVFSLSVSFDNSGAGNGDTLTVKTDKETSTSSKNVLRKKNSYTSAIKFFGVDLSPDNIAVAMVYFVQGVLGLARLAVSFYLKDDLHLDPAEVCHCFLRILNKKLDLL